MRGQQVYLRERIPNAMFVTLSTYFYAGTRMFKYSRKDVVYTNADLMLRLLKNDTTKTTKSHAPICCCETTHQNFRNKLIAKTPRTDKMRDLMPQICVHLRLSAVRFLQTPSNQHNLFPELSL